MFERMSVSTLRRVREKKREREERKQTAVERPRLTKQSRSDPESAGREKRREQQSDHRREQQ